MLSQLQNSYIGQESQIVGNFCLHRFTEKHRYCRTHLRPGPPWSGPPGPRGRHTDSFLRHREVCTSRSRNNSSSSSNSSWKLCSTAPDSAEIKHTKHSSEPYDWRLNLIVSRLSTVNNEAFYPIQTAYSSVRNAGTFKSLMTSKNIKIIRRLF